MTRDAEWLRKLAEAYFDPSVHTDLALDDDDPSEPGYDRSEAVVSQVVGLPDEPEDCWLFIQTACRLPLSDEQLGLLGAGVFEDLMDAYGVDFIERVEQAAAESPNVRAVVSGAWTMSMEQEVATRIEAMQSGRVAQDNAQRRKWWHSRER